MATGHLEARRRHLDRRHLSRPLHGHRAAHRDAAVRVRGRRGVQRQAQGEAGPARQRDRGRQELRLRLLARAGLLLPEGLRADRSWPEGFARIFLQNAINLGLNLVTAPDIEASEGDELEVTADKVVNKTTGKPFADRPAAEGPPGHHRRRRPDPLHAQARDGSGRQGLIGVRHSDELRLPGEESFRRHRWIPRSAFDAPRHAGLGWPSSPPEPGEAAEDAMKRILVVDDDRTTLRMIRLQLEGPATRSRPPATAPRPSSRLRRKRFDLVLLDVWMPGMDGLEVLSRLRGAPSQPRVVVMTADDAPETLLRAVREHALPVRDEAGRAGGAHGRRGLVLASSRTCGRSRWSRRSPTGWSCSCPATARPPTRIQEFLLAARQRPARAGPRATWARPSASC